MRYLIVASLGLLVVVTISCKKLIEIDTPPNQLTDDKVFNSSGTLTAAVVNIYFQLGQMDANLVAATSSYTDETRFNYPELNAAQFYTNTLLPTNVPISNFWKLTYFAIYQSNLILENLATSNLSPQLTEPAKGEVCFLRAYCYFLLMNYYGDVPLLTTTDVRTTAIAGRVTVQEINAQIAADLRTAKQLLPESYPDGEKTRATKDAATALLSRYYLYTQQWAKAAIEADLLLGNPNYNLPALSLAFKRNSPEAIWQLWNVNGLSTQGQTFVPTSGVPQYSLTSGLLNSFEPGDGRKTTWTKELIVSGNSYYIPFKYRNNSNATGAAIEYTTYFRLAEEYLIKAEAKAMLNEISEALIAVNKVRLRAGLAAVVMPVAKDSCLKLIEQERRVELFSELSHRFFDLKRTNRIDAVLPLTKPNWKPTAKLYPIPRNEVNVNPFLIQNPGY